MESEFPVGCSGNSTYESAARDRGLLMNRDLGLVSVPMAIEIWGMGDACVCSCDIIFDGTIVEFK